MSTEKSYKEASGFFTQFFNTCISILKVLVRSNFSSKMPTAQSNTCIVLGNGPSLNQSFAKYKVLFSKHSLYCVNSFSLSNEYTELKPQYYVILDFAFWMSDAKIIMDTIDAIKTKTTWPVILFVPRMASKSSRFRKLCEENSNIKVNYFNYTVFRGFEGISHWFFKKNLAMPQSQNVLVAATFLSINTGFKEIYIVGADHTWHEHLHVDENNVLNNKQFHFYENEEKIAYVPFKKGAHLNETFKVHEIFATWAKAFYGYIVLQNYANSKNCKIYNASEVTFIDAFERKKL